MGRPATWSVRVQDRFTEYYYVVSKVSRFTVEQGLGSGESSTI
jgi:hypothetical protein